MQNCRSKKKVGYGFFWFLHVMLGTKVIKIRPLVPNLDLVMSKQSCFDILRANLGTNGAILMILVPNIKVLSMPNRFEWFTRHLGGNLVRGLNTCYYCYRVRLFRWYEC